MARSGKTAQEFIQGSFSPIIAVVSSPKVETVVSKNNLSFTELLQPFTNIDCEGQFREPGGSVCVLRNWKLVVRDVNWKPLQPTEARRQLNNAVLHNYNEKTVALELEGHKLDVPQSTPWFEAWRETFLEVQFPSDHEFTKHFVSCIIVGTTHDDNIVDTYNTLNQQFARLQNVTPPKLPKWFNNEILKSYLLLHDVSSLPKEKADAAFDSLKQNFGSANCFMLSINSKTTVDPCLPTDLWTHYIKRLPDSNVEMSSIVTNTPLEPQATVPSTVSKDENTLTASTIHEGVHPLTIAENDVYDYANSLQTHSFSGSSESVNISTKATDFSMEVHGAALNANDIEALKKFVQEYASKALLPHLEKQISVLSEGVTTRKGVSRSLISATKRWFNTGKAGTTTVSNTVIYSNDCPELQLRRLGDLWFLCGQWQRAFDAYHTAKREFYADSAWLCYAGALEMAALSAFMAGDSNRKTHAYMEESIVTYLNTCRMAQYAVRATLLSVVCLSGCGQPGEAAKQLIRMTSEDSDLRSAMLLEQAALCFLASPAKALRRKYAFHMVLAGHRFSKSGQKKHAYRCYRQAYQVYGESGWRMATDHVQFALGRLAGALRLPHDAVRWLRAPLAPRSLQPPHQQAAFTRQYTRQHQEWVESTDEFKERLPELPLPLLESKETTVLCVGPEPLSSPGRVRATSLTVHDDTSNDGDHYWNKMEEMLLQVARGSVPMIFKPTVDLYTEMTDANPVVPQGEPIKISITLRNPLNIPLVLKDLELLWQFVPSPEDTIKCEVLNNEPAVAAGTTLDTNVICGQKVKSVVVEEDCKKIITFTLTSLRVGKLSVHGLAYKFYSSGEGDSDIGSVTIAGKINLLSGVNVTDKRLQITVIPYAPCLQMTFSETSPDVLSGELRAIDMELRNVGPVEFGNLFIAVSHPDCVSLPTVDCNEQCFSTLYEDKYREPPTYTDERAARNASWVSCAARHVRGGFGGGGGGGAGGVGVGGGVRLRLRAARGAPALRLLAYYETGQPRRPYRLLRHVFRFNVSEAVDVTVTPRRNLRTSLGATFENLNLAVEVKNLNDGKVDEISIEVLEASLLSRQWKLSDLTAARNKDQQLAPHERLHLIFKGRRLEAIPPEGRVEYSKLKVSNSSEAADDITVPPYCNFVMENNKPSYFDINETMSQENPKNKGLIQSMFVLRWKAHNKTKGTSVIGQHCLWLDCFAKAESREKEQSVVVSPALQLDDFDHIADLTETKRNKDNTVVFQLEHSSHISHNFNERKLCLVPITINIVNCYGYPVQVFIDMSKHSNRESFGVLGWTGALSNGAESESKELGVSVYLDRFESRRMTVRAVCGAPGTYLVGAAFNVRARRTAAAGPRAALPAAIANNNASLLIVQRA